MVNGKNVNGRTPEVKADTANATAADGDGNVDAPAPDETPGSPEQYSPEWWAQWETEHPDESWISYVDADRNPQRVPVWRYRELGL